jgi:hypothetical protein
LPNGGFVICWDGSDDNLLDDYEGLIAQVYDSTGSKVGSKIPVNSETYYFSTQSLPCICSLINGGFVICWESFPQDGSGSGIYGQLYDQNYIEIGNEFRINTYTKNFQEEPSISAIINGGFVVSWHSMYQDGSLNGIYAKYFMESQLVHSIHSFSLISPKFDATIYMTTVEFKWHKASSIHVNFPWELTYTLYIDVTNEFNNPEIFSVIYDSTFSVENMIPGQTYFWKVMAKTYEGDSLWSSETFGFYVSPAADIEDNLKPEPEHFELFPNYPNPFNPTTMINYQTPNTQYVEAGIYNLLGQKVVTLVSQKQNAGFHQVEWDASGFTSGVYFLVLDAGNFKATQKMLLVK